MPAQRQAPRTQAGRGRGKAAQEARGDSIFDLLKQDHERVKDLFEQVEDGDMEEREDLFSQIEDELNTHMEGEEKLFYPVLEENDEMREKVMESYEEHHVAQTVLEEFSELPSDDERWKAKMRVLRNFVERHIEEEEQQVFKKARRTLDKEQQRELARRYEEQKEKQMGAR